MNWLEKFVAFLKDQKKKPSLLTVKNYKADIGQFISWFEKEFSLSFDPLKVTHQIIDQYKKSRSLSASSTKRHLSSLRKFFGFLKATAVVKFELFAIDKSKEKIEPDPWMLKNFKNFLYEYKKSNLTIKNYINDIKSFFLWLGEVSLTKYAWDVAEKNLLSKINYSIVEEYKRRLIESKFAPRSINRKLSSLRNYINWAKNQGLISWNNEFMPVNNLNRELANKLTYGSEYTNSETQNTDKTSYSSFPPLRLIQKTLGGVNLLFDSFFILPIVSVIENAQDLFWETSRKKIFIKSHAVNAKPIANIQKEFYAPLSISVRYLSKHKRIWHYLRHVRPNWYKKYHDYSITHYFHFAILVILSSAVGFGMYNGFFLDLQKGNSLAKESSASPRVLSFQGKLTDSFNSPINKPTSILFSIYNDENASGAAFLWQENDSIIPDSQGVFSILLGRNNPIPNTLFSQNLKLFLGIAVGNSPELRPRQQLATVPFAGNAETLQGLEPITNTDKVSNVVLALDSSGNLNIAGSKTHTFQAIGGNLVLSGSVLSLTTVPGSNSRVEIVPDGIGKIDLSKPIQNSTNNNNLSAVAGAVEFDDLVAILATSSAQSAFTINQNSTGPLISASTSGTAKFTIANDGTGTFAGDVGINGGDLTSTATTFNLLNSTVTTLNLAGAATNLVLGSTTGTITIRNASAAIQGNITLGDAATDTLTFTGRVAQDSDLVPIGTTGTNDLGSSSLPWDNAYIDNIYSASTGTFGHWQRANGAVIPTNISDDVLIGATATSSALIKLSGTSGNNSWINTGNVGIGTTAPSFILDIQNSQASTASAQIFNTNTGTDADGLIVKLGNTSTSAVASTNHFISFETAGIGIVGSVQGNGGKGVTFATSGIADFAEYFEKDGNQTIEYGSVVCLKDNGLAVKCDDFNSKVLGVASETPAFLGGKNLGNSSIAVGLIGQVEILVSNANGSIKAGDALTASDIPGVAMKAIKAGPIVGKALEDLNIIDESKTVGFYDPDNKEYRNKANFPDIPIKPNIIRVAKIYALVNVSWHDPSAYLTNTGELYTNSTNNSYFISSPLDESLANIGTFFEVMSANIKVGLLHASEIVTDSLIVGSDSLIVNGQNLKDYIVGLINESTLNQDFGRQAEIISPIVKTSRLTTDIISPLSEDSNMSISLDDSQFQIYNSNNASGSAVAKIDDQGNASFSGTINSLALETNDATISGTLRAGSIVADSIFGLDKFLDLSSYSAQLAYVKSIQAEQALFNQGLMVFGSTSLLDVSVAGQLSINGSMFLGYNSIETLGVDLSFQTLKQGGLSIMGGLVYIDTDGNLKVQGNVSIAGRLAVNIISPLPTSDLVINNASGSGILSVSKNGDVVASGSGTFSKLNFSLVQPAQAISATELIASSSAGTAQISPHQTEVTIQNALITDKSVIYITPVGTPSAQTPFLMRQLSSQFSVGVQSPTSKPIPFNWLIVN